MRQAIVKKGTVVVTEVPAPIVSKGGVLIKVVSSCISAGTELFGLSESGKPLIKRAIEQPENVKKVLDMVRSDGVARAYRTVRGLMDTGTPIGYSLSGIVIAVSKEIQDICPGDRVAAAGAGRANHAEYVDVPRNLVVPIPKNVSFDHASGVALGAIAMQAVRRANATIGEFALVFGTGILGQLCLQMLVTSGARVISIDLDRKKLALSEKMGAERIFHPDDEDILRSVMHYTGGHGVDVTIFCAATKDNKALSDAFKMTRKKGRLVMLGVWGKELKREDIYKKELDFFISTSYGPGRYDDKYEAQGLDYPYAYVRWTENRNMVEYLRLIADGRIDVRPLIQHRYSILDAHKAFQSLQTPERPLMVVLSYGESFPEDFDNSMLTSLRKIRTFEKTAPHHPGVIRVGIIGAGGFAIATHLPNLIRLPEKYDVRAVCAQTGFKAKAVADQFGARYATTDFNEIISDDNIDMVMICTRHHLHARMVLASMAAGKHTFVEKPMCVSFDQLEAIKRFVLNRSSPSPGGELPLLMVGFNRRFSKYAKEIKKHVISRINPLFLHYRMNAGFLPLDHWVHGGQGGGRIVGEACHIIDLFSYFVEAPVKSYSAGTLIPNTESISGSDNKSLILEYEDGSVGTIEYFAVGSRDFPKEYLEIHFDEKSIVMNNYKQLKGYGLQMKEMKDKIPQKGHREELVQLADCLTGKLEGWPIKFESIVETTGLSLMLK